MTSPAEDNSDASDFVPYSVGGAVLGCAVIVWTLVLDAAMLAIARYFSSDIDSDTHWPAWAIVLCTIVAVVVSICFGRWLFRLRRWIGRNGDPADRRRVVRKRRHFTVGSMTAYLVLTPFALIVAMSMANRS